MSRNVSCWLCIVLTVSASRGLSAAEDSRSLALKGTAPSMRILYTPPNNSFSRLWDAVTLIQKASSGDPFAQHELGLCYLTGKNWKADTLKAAYWIGKAAGQDLLYARYNMGILTNNGWGVPWNPFEAYKNFKYAARHGMKEAQYVYGILMTDNLTVERNLPEAVRWIRASADSGYAPAKETLAELEKRGLSATVSAPSERDTTRSGRSPGSATNPSSFSAPQPVRADFSSDSIRAPEDRDLLREALPESLAGGSRNGESANADTILEKTVAAALPLIRLAADAGSPEALVLAGRLCESGSLMTKDDVLAAVYYLRAIRNNSPRAPVLLWRLTREEGYFDLLKTRVGLDDPAAKFVWADLTALGFDTRISDAQALLFLQAAAGQQFNEAVLELGLIYYTGKWVIQDREKGMSLLKQAANSGSREARVRLWMIELGSGENPASASLVDSLRQASGEGSLLAQTMLGFCYQKGIGVDKNVAWSVGLYRKAMQRGSKAAFNALVEMYNAIRPDDPEFLITE
jgi:TPR repeat protein